MGARETASGPGRLFDAVTAAFFLVAPFPHSAGWRVSLLLAAIAALVWHARADPRRIGLALVPRAFALAALAWCAWCVASLAWSVDAGYTLQELRREILYDALAFVVFFAGTREPAQLQRLAAIALGATILLGAAEWLHLAFPSQRWLARASVGPGPLATQVVLVAPLLVLLVWPRPMGAARRPAIALAVAAALAVAGLAGDSRALWVSIAIAIVTAFAVYSADVPADAPSRKLARRTLVIALAALALLMAASAEYKMRNYQKAGSTVEALAYDQRPLIWEAAWRKLGERPWLGYGYGRDIVAADIQRATPEAGFPLNHAHNVFLDMALELGVVGLALFVALMATLAFALARLRTRSGGVALAVAGLATIAGYLAKNLTDDFFFRPHALQFWAIAGMLLAAGARAPPER